MLGLYQVRVPLKMAAGSLESVVSLNDVGQCLLELAWGPLPRGHHDNPSSNKEVNRLPSPTPNIRCRLFFAA